MTTIVATTTAANGVPFTVVIVRAGETSPRNGHGYRPERDVVEFYDTRHPFTAYGQFVADYYVETLTSEGAAQLARGGLNLHGGEPDWTIDGATMTKLIRGIEAATETGHAAALGKYEAALADARRLASVPNVARSNAWAQRDVLRDALNTLIAAIDNVDASA